MAEDPTQTDRESADEVDHGESASDQVDEGLLAVVIGERRDEVVEQSPADVSWRVDELCAGAIELARDVLLEEVGAEVVGDHIGVVADGPMVVTHYFKGSVPGYTGWQWSVTVTRAPDSDHVTVDETALLPDGSTLLAPAWVPWRQRIEAGDLGTGDVLVTDADDPRLVPGMSDNDVPDPHPDDELRPEPWELGLGRERVLSPEGRREAAQRWYREVGPGAGLARGTDLQCATCGFLLLIGGPLGQGFGVCANGYSPVDGRIVALNFGCGAHSETRERPSVGVAETVIDEMSYDDMGPAEGLADEAQPADPNESESAAGTDESGGGAGPVPSESAAGTDGGGDGAAAGAEELADAADVNAGDLDSPAAEVGAAAEPAAEGPDSAVPETDGSPVESNAPGSVSDADEDPSAAGDRTDRATMHEPGSKEGT